MVKQLSEDNDSLLYELQIWFVRNQGKTPMTWTLIVAVMSHRHETSSVAARGRPLNSKLWGGVAAPGWRARGAAPLRRIAGGQCGVHVSVFARWALVAWGPLPKPAVCRRWLRGGARRFVPRGGARSGPIAVTSPTCAMPQQSISHGATRGSTASRQTMTAYCKVLDRVPRPHVT